MKMARAGALALTARPGVVLALALALTALPGVVLQARAESNAQAAPRRITLASTTSTRDSGLLDFLLPRFTARTGIAVRVVAVGTGHALALGRRGDVDALLVHDRDSEDAFVASGHGLFRRDVMFNDFVILGPAEDPAGLRSAKSAAAALRRVAARRALFLSRGDDSGTHKAELRLWASAGIAPRAHSGHWYRETGSGMGAALNTAAQLHAYLLSDRSTWLAFQNPGGLQILVQGDPLLHNPYGVLVVNPRRHPHVQAGAARQFADWLTGAEGQAAIGAFRRRGQPLFFPVAPAAPIAPGAPGE